MRPALSLVIFGVCTLGIGVWMRRRARGARYRDEDEDLDSGDGVNLLIQQEGSPPESAPGTEDTASDEAEERGVLALEEQAEDVFSHDEHPITAVKERGTFIPPGIAAHRTDAQKRSVSERRNKYIEGLKVRGFLRQGATAQRCSRQ